jgi:L-aminopeptidase/D-esterase-like protein
MMSKNLLMIGHATREDISSGVTVFILPQMRPCGYWLCGSAPATREVSLLDAAATVPGIDALVFTGGSAFGLDVTRGVMQWLCERGRGFSTSAGVVPIVPTAAIFDLSVGQAAAPTADDAYRACANAVVAQHQQGRIGAGTGASVGKLASSTQSMPGGLGWAEHVCENGLQVLVYAVVNCVGDVIDEQANIIAGAKDKKGFVNLQSHFMTGQPTCAHLLTQTNTTLVAVFTNAQFDKAQLTRIAKAASAGMARAIRPVFTAYDGDVIFAASTDDIVADEVTVGIIAAELVRQAIVSALI